MKNCRTIKYDLGRLVNIRDRALKSLLAGKFLKARNQNIVFNVEVPEEIQVEGMSLLDFLTIVSILVTMLSKPV